MRFNVNIKPTVYTGYGTFYNAIEKFLHVIPSVSCFTGSKYGWYYAPIKRRNDNSPEYIYCYNVDVFKRGKHKKNKHFTLYVYKIDIRLLDILGMKVEQKHRNFRIVQDQR